jgi:hypothetical protein
MERKMAEQIVALVNGCIDQMIATLGPVEEAVSPEEFASYKRGVAKVIAAFDAEVIDRIAREHPDLKPADDDVDTGPSHEPGPPKGSRN